MGMPPIKPDFGKLVVKLGDHDLGSPGLEDIIIKNMSKAMADEIEEMMINGASFEIGTPKADIDAGSITVPIAIKQPVERFVITLGVSEDMPPRERAICLQGTLEELRRKLGEKK